MSNIKKRAVSGIIGIAIFMFVLISFIYNEYFVPETSGIGFSGVYEKKYVNRRPFYVFRISEDSTLTFPSSFLFDDFREQIEIGDSVEKIKNINFCIIKKKNGVIKIIKFESEE